MKFSRRLLASAVTALMIAAVPAHAAIASLSTCSFADVSGIGLTVTDCSGYYVGNLNPESVTNHPSDRFQVAV